MEGKKLMVKPVYKAKPDESYDPKLEEVEESKGPKKIEEKFDLENFTSVVNK